MYKLCCGAFGGAQSQQQNLQLRAKKSLNFDQEFK